MADVANGTTVAFGTSSFSHELLSVSLGSISRESVRTTHLGTTTAETFMPGDIYDGGEMTMTIAHDGDEQPPISAAAETITITWPVPSGGSTGATAQFSGFVTGYTINSNEANERMTAEVTVKVSGAVTFADST